MDSKSKLQSKNPNKIQTAKIQSPKVSKDLVNPQSPKVVESNLKLDSKTRQKSNKESESKQPKIQRVKNTYDSTNSQKSKESSKVKSLIRTIPVSITLAMALSSQIAVAQISADKGGVIKDSNGSIINAGTTIINNETMQNIAGSFVGNNATILNATIVNGTIVNGEARIRNIGLTNNNNFVNGTIINGWNFRNGVTGQSDGAGGATITNVINSGTITFPSMPIGVIIGQAGNLTIGKNTHITTNAGGTAFAVGMIFIGKNTKVATITNEGTLHGARVIKFGDNGIADAIINKGIIISESGEGAIKTGTGVEVGTIINTGTIRGVAGGGLIDLEKAKVKELNIDGGVVERTDNNNAIVLTSSGTLDNFTITNGASITGNINIQGNSKVGTMAIGGKNSTGTITQITGNISLANSTIINGLSLYDSANISGNITLANQSTIANGLSLSGNSTIANLNLTERGNIDTLSLNQGTITGGISLTGNANGTDTNTATIGEITLANNSTITGDISVKGDGASANANAKIGNITLEDGTGIGGSIAVGDSNGASNTNGVITGITLNGNSTIAGGIINNANGNIGTIISNTNDGVSNIITNSGTIAKLEVKNGSTSGGNGGTIVYRSDSGIITDTLSVASGATLAIKNIAGNTGTIELKSDGLTLNGSTLDLATDSTLEGHLKNSGNLGHWTNESKIQGNFINASGASVEDLIAGEIKDNLLNEGEITNLTINKNIGTLTNNGSGIINTLTIQNGSNIDNGITNNSNIGSLNLQENV
ncbi:beta strand repeat-containing protein, partial [Helicobacter pullorum]